MSQKRQGFKIGVVDDNADALASVRMALIDKSFGGAVPEIWTASGSEEALALLALHADTDILILDVVMETQTAGLELVGRIRQGGAHRNMRILVLTGAPGRMSDEDAVHGYDISDWITKGTAGSERLRGAVFLALRSKRELDSLSEQKEVLNAALGLMSDMTHEGASEAFMGRVLDLLAKAAGVSPWLAYRLSKGGRYKVVAKTGEILPNELTQPLRGFGETTAKALSKGRKAFAVSVDGESESCLLAPIGGLNEKDPSVSALVGVLRSAVLAMANEQSKVKSLTIDPHTGVLSRQGFLSEARSVMQGAKEPFAVYIVDLAGFGRVNAALGHDAGDAILKAAADRISAFAADRRVGRIASDTFAIMSPIASFDSSLLNDAFQNPLGAGGIEVSMRVRVGAAGVGPGDDPQKALAKAAMALDAAKCSGMSGGTPTWFDERFESEARERLGVSQRLFEALGEKAAGGLFMVYQPQINLSDLSVSGAEALMRWRAPDGSLVPPDRFIQIAEQAGLISRISDFAFSFACKTIRRGLDAGIVMPRIAVNISALEFDDPQLVDRLRGMIGEHSIPEGAIEVEITETAATKDHDRMISTLESLSAMGMSVAMDDFGSGYSSLGQLHRMPIRKLKIDRVFINALGSSGVEGGIAKMIIDLGKLLGMKIVAEGVETQSQADILLSMGADSAQGWLYAKGMEEDGFFKWMDDWSGKIMRGSE